MRDMDEIKWELLKRINEKSEMIKSMPNGVDGVENPFKECADVGEAVGWVDALAWVLELESPHDIVQEEGRQGIQR